MAKIPPISYPLHTGEVTTIKDVIDRAIQSYTATGKANCAAMQLNLNTQVLVVVGNPSTVNEALMKLIGVVLSPDLLIKH